MPLASGEKIVEGAQEGVILVDVFPPAAEQYIFGHQETVVGGVFGMKKGVGEKVFG